MPLTRRIPKRGFRNIGRQMYEIINIAALSRLAPNTEVTPEFLKEQGLIKGKRPIKILGDGELPVPLTVRVHRISRSAREKIIKAQGKVEELK
jgi:large subunit ribosomal protein L15